MHFAHTQLSRFFKKNTCTDAVSFFADMTKQRHWPCFIQLYLVVLTAQPLIGSENDDLFSSVTDMKLLCDQTNPIIEQLRKYDQKLHEQINAIDWYLDNAYYEHDKLDDISEEEYVSTPINTFKMIQRLSSTIGVVTRQFQGNDMWDESLKEDVDRVTLSIKELDRAGKSLEN